MCNTSSIILVIARFDNNEDEVEVRDDEAAEDEFLLFVMIGGDSGGDWVT